MIGRAARRVAVADALEHVLGYTCLNDVSARDLQFGDGQWTRGKSLDTFCPIGPVLVTADELGDAQDLAISCSVGGERAPGGAHLADVLLGGGDRQLLLDGVHPGARRHRRHRHAFGRRRLPQAAAVPGATATAWRWRSSASASSRTSAGSRPRRRRRHERRPTAATASASSSPARSAASAPGRSASSCARACRSSPSTWAATRAAIALIVEPDELDADRVRRGRHHRPRRRWNGRSTSTTSRTSSTSPRCRCRSAGPTRRAAPQVNVTGTVNVFEAVKRRGAGMAPVVYTGLDRDVLAVRRRSRSAAASRRTPTPIRATTTASTSSPTRARPASTGPTRACRASGCAR